MFIKKYSNGISYVGPVPFSAHGADRIPDDIIVGSARLKVL